MNELCIDREFACASRQTLEWLIAQNSNIQPTIAHLVRCAERSTATILGFHSGNQRRREAVGRKAKPNRRALIGQYEVTLAASANELESVDPGHSGLIK